jgi:polyketide synthase PksJ
MKQREYNGLEIAVIGMASRFPKSKDIQQFWNNLIAGNECITIDKVEDGSGLIKAKGILEDNECFDFDFFNYSPNEAELLDPQIRVLHECTWEALEDAGYNPFTYGGLIGNFVGASTNPTSDLNRFLHDKNGCHELWSNLLYSDKDFISTRISHKLNLRGPSLTLDTACSTSLTAIDVACQGLLTGKCDMAVAGGISITYHDENGYVYKDGFISSPDGHCRAFDEDAKGTVTGNGVGVVILKRLEDALKDGDKIDAIILGSAVNNDGVTKQGYTAPSREGQVGVIRSAHQMASISSETISYIEAHGTATQVGDPIEIDALKIAFNTNKKNYCAIGSVKTNLGHLDAAAGVAGFIKAVLVLKNKQIPPTLHFKKPNSKFDLSNSPFYINSEPIKWGDSPLLRRAGVSSFGIGGTNVHVVLEEAPKVSHDASVRSDVFLLSARVVDQLLEVKNNFETYIDSAAIDALAFNDVAHTLRTGRKHFKYKIAIQASSINDLKEKLKKYHVIEKRTHSRAVGKTVFMFSGQGSQYLNMTKELYQQNTYYREQLDHCITILNTIYNRDIKSILFHDGDNGPTEINNTLYTQPFLVAVEYAMAKLLMQCGVQPDIVIGHSVGEYTAACIAGIFSLDDMLTIVSKRAAFMGDLEKGSMLAVNIEKDKLLNVLPDDVTLAAENSNKQMVISGSFTSIAGVREILQQQQWAHSELHTSHAFHSRMMLPIAEALEKEIAKMTLHPPSVCYISNVTGKEVSYEEINKPSYWSDQMTNTVLFKECILSAVRAGATQFMEVGPGIALQTFVKAIDNDVETTGFVRHAKEAVNDVAYFLEKLASLWERGNKIDWNEVFQKQPRRKVSLPTYPFIKNQIPVRRIDFNTITEHGNFQKTSGDDTLKYYAPIWTQSVMSKNTQDNVSVSVLMLSFDVNKDASLIEGIRRSYPESMLIELGSHFCENSTDHLTIDAINEEGYEKVLLQLMKRGHDEIKIILFDNQPEELLNGTPLAALQAFSFLIKSLTASTGFKKKNIYAITFNLQNVLNEAVADAYSSTLLGALKVVSCEHNEINCTSIDIDRNELLNENLLVVDKLNSEIAVTPSDIVVAYRKNIRWVQDFQEIVPHVNTTKLEQSGVYVITGGVGGMACTIAAYLLEKYAAHVVLIGRSNFLRNADWSSTEWVDALDVKYQPGVKNLIAKCQASKGSLISFQANVSELESVRDVFEQVTSTRKSIDGIFHTAGVIDYGGVMQRRSFDSLREVMLPKVQGTDNLIKCIEARGVKPGFLLLFSSNGNIFYAYKYGQAGYNAANEYMDAISSVRRSANTDIKAINWNDWYDVGMTVDSLNNKFDNISNDDFRAKIDDGIMPEEGMAVIENILNSSLRRVVISKKDVKKEIANMNYLLQNNKSALWSGLLEHSSLGGRAYKRPALETLYQSPRTVVEEQIIEELAKYLKYESIGVYDNFFELGLTSLDLVQISTRLSERLKSDINVTTLFTYPTVDLLTGKLDFNAKTENPTTFYSNADDLQNSLELFK